MSESKYKFVGDVHAGAIGDKAQGILMNKHTSDVGDLESLMQELRQLREVMKGEASNAEQFQALAHVAEAEEEAKKGNKEKALKALQLGGKWALDVATKIGTSLAGAYLKQTLGL
jgi:hypothetical protein